MHGRFELIIHKSLQDTWRGILVVGMKGYRDVLEWRIETRTYMTKIAGA